MSPLRHSSTRILSALVAVGLAATALVGCSASDTNSSAGTAESASTPAETTGGDGAQSIPDYKRKADETLEAIGGNDGKWSPDVANMPYKDAALPPALVFHDVRVGEHADFYRVVLEFKKDPTADPSADAKTPWEAGLAWTDTPITLGKGDAMDSSGKAFLDVTLDRTVMATSPELEKIYFAGDKNIAVGPLEVLVDGTVENKTHVVIAMDEKRPIQTAFLTYPARFVIDVKK